MSAVDRQTFDEGVDHIIDVIEKTVVQPLTNAKAARANGDTETANLNVRAAISNLRDLTKNIERDLGVS